MSVTIKTNQLNYTLNKEKLSRRYDVFKLCTSEKYFKHGAYIIDAPLLNNNVCSVLFKSGREFFVLMNQCDSNFISLKKVLTDAEGYENITLTNVSFDSIADDVIIQLLLNSLGSFETDFIKFNNLTGHLYCFHPKWLIKGKKGGTDTILKIPCLELKVTSEYRLNLEIHTFTSELLRNSIEFKKKGFESYPKYILSANDTFRRKLSSDTGSAFIMRQTKNTKTDVPFLDIQNIDHFDRCKMGIVAQVVEDFNKKFCEAAHIDFAGIENYESLDYTRSTANENKHNISKILSTKPIKIIDHINNMYSKRFCEEICDLLFSKYGVKAKIGKRVSSDHLNIRVIHDASYYINSEDPHKSFQGASVQHITFENFLDNSEFAISTVVHELLIKEDLKNRKISLFEWSKLKFDDDIDFGIEFNVEQNTKYIFMTIHPDGSFDIFEQTLNLFEFNQYTKCVEIYENAKIKSEKVMGIIKDSSGNINVIKDTGWFTIPEINKIKKELSEGNTKIRGKEKRTELLSSCLDIKMFKEDKNAYYFVGTIGNGMRTSINCAANIRKIEPFENSKLMFERLLPLMNVSFVHNGQLTVVPFPFKYLREYIKLM